VEEGRQKRRYGGVGKTEKRGKGNTPAARYLRIGEVTSSESCFLSGDGRKQHDAGEKITEADIYHEKPAYPPSRGSFWLILKEEGISKEIVSFSGGGEGIAVGNR